jgi:hypothetical protein
MKARLTGLWLALCLCTLASPARAAVTAALSATQIPAGTTVQLTLTYDGLTTSEPDLTPLRAAFDILGSSSSTSVQFGTGGSAESSQVVLTLAPKRSGQLTIPPIVWDGEHSRALTLTVAGAANGTSGHAGAASAAVFIVSHMKPAQPYVQAQIQLTVRIYAAEQIYHGSLDFSGNGNVLVKEVGADQYGSTVRDGRTYQVITRHFVLFPQRSGRITLPGPVLDAQIAAPQGGSSWGGNPFGGFFGGLMRTLRPIEVHGDPIVLSVRPRPTRAHSRDWLPASDLTLAAHWHPRSLTVQAGDPLTVTLDVQAVGLTAAQLPDLAARLAIPAGVRAYPDQAKLDDVTQGTGITGRRTQTIALIARHPGQLLLPALTIHWWDTQTDQPRVTTLPAQSLTIVPAAGAPAGSMPGPTRPAPMAEPHRAPGAPPPSAARSRAARSHGRLPWPWLTLAMAVLWIGTLGGWLWSRRRRARPAAAASAPKRPPQPDAASERSAFRAACARNDAVAARRHLLSWMAAAWGVPATSLNPLAAASRDPHLSAALRELERACYGGADWHGEPLAQALRELPKRIGSSDSRTPPLPPLYP